MAPLGGKGTDEAFPTLNLYEKLTDIFQRDYRSTLHSVPFEHLRTGSAGSIDRLPIKTILTQSHGSNNNGSGDVPWGGTSGTVAASVSDPAEWHIGPYCHVYIAACESLDQYRNRVRPALQAFISLIEGAASSSSNRSQNNKGAQSSGNYSAHYVIVYAPIRGKKGDGSSSDKDKNEGLLATNRLGGAIASRLNQARRIASAGAKDIPNGSLHSISYLMTSQLLHLLVRLHIPAKSKRKYIRNLLLIFQMGRYVFCLH